MTYSAYIYDKFGKFEMFSLDEEDKTSLVWKFQDDSTATISLRNRFDDIILFNKSHIAKISIKVME